MVCPVLLRPWRPRISAGSALVHLSVIGLLLSGLPVRALAGEGVESPRGDSRLTVNFSLGYVLQPENGGLWPALIDASFNADYCGPSDPGFCSGGSTPTGSGGAFAYSFALGYSLNPRWEIRALASLEDGCTSTGVRRLPARSEIHLHGRTSRWGVLMLYRPPGSVLRIGLGPALHQAEAGLLVGGRERSTCLGAAFDAGLSFPRRSRIFVDLEAQYWYGGDTQFGPYDTDGFLEPLTPSFPSSSYSVDRLIVGLGLGFRI
jgi:hypothetical protein